MPRHTIANLFVAASVAFAALVPIVGIVDVKASAPAISTAAELYAFPVGCNFTSIQEAVDAKAVGRYRLPSTVQGEEK